MDSSLRALTMRLFLIRTARVGVSMINCACRIFLTSRRAFVRILLLCLAANMMTVPSSEVFSQKYTSSPQRDHGHPNFIALPPGLCSQSNETGFLSVSSSLLLKVAVEHIAILKCMCVNSDAFLNQCPCVIFCIMIKVHGYDPGSSIRTHHHEFSASNSLNFSFKYPLSCRTLRGTGLGGPPKWSPGHRRPPIAGGGPEGAHPPLRPE